MTVIDKDQKELIQEVMSGMDLLATNVANRSVAYTSELYSESNRTSEQSEDEISIGSIDIVLSEEDTELSKER